MEVLLNEMDSTRKIQIRMSLFTVHLAIANGMAMHSVLVGMKIDVFLNSKMKFVTLLLFAACIAAAPVHDLMEVNTYMTDCNICMGVAVQIQRAPTSFIMCSDPRCKQITKDILNSFHSEPVQLKLCSRLGYC